MNNARKGGCNKDYNTNGHSYPNRKGSGSSSIQGDLAPDIRSSNSQLPQSQYRHVKFNHALIADYERDSFIIHEPRIVKL